MLKHLSSALAISVPCVLAVIALSAAPDSEPKPGVDWPSFRGIRGAGIADGFTTATTWDVPEKKNVRWSAAIPGLGHSSPVIWGSRLCVTTAISGRTDAGLRPGLYGDIASVEDSTSHTWKLMCFDKNSGRPLVDKVIYSGIPKIKRHTKSTHANTTLATDGTRLIAMLGSEGLHAFDFDGNRLWTKDLGVLDSGYYLAPGAQWEFASSPIIHDGKVVIQADVQKGSFIAAFDVATGKEHWRTARQEIPTFSTPAIHQFGGNTQVLVNGWKHTGAYDLATGREIWKLNGGGDIPVPVPVTGHGLVFITNAHGPGAPVYAIRETATGDISLAAGETTNANIAWSVPRDGAYLISPVLYRDLLYVCKNNGVFTVFDAKTGERVYQQRLGSGTTAFTASIIAADGKVYFTSEEGDVYVVKAGRTYELLSQNPLGGITMATPAVSEGTLYFRTSDKIIAIK
jgi:outer membrane protein assembly factor BamB